MKKALSFILVMYMFFALVGCVNNVGEHRSADGPVADQQSNSGEDSRVFKETDAGREDRKIDVDLTKLSSTMVYSEVYNMMYTPEGYIGKTVKMNGAFALYCQKTDENGQPDLNYPIYYACVIADATACCSQGLEFVPAGNFTYPDDYPEPGGDITVIGTFETYEEGGDMYCHLINAELTV